MKTPTLNAFAGRAMMTFGPLEHLSLKTPMPTNTEIDIIQCDKSTEAAHLPDAHFLLGLDCQTGETFGNPASQTLDAFLCAAHDGVEMITHRDAVLLPLEWLYTEYPKRRELWEVQCDALHRYARKNGLPFIEPWTA
jgi:hypothetical protein